MATLALALAILGVVIGVLFAILLVYLALPLPFPLHTESDYSHHSTPWWEIYYGHKYLRPIRRPALGSGLKEQFDSANFDFDSRPLAEVRRVSLSATGDLMFRRDLAGPGGARLWDDVGSQLFGADLAIGNLEFAVNPKCVIEKTLRFSVPSEYALPLLGDPQCGRFHVLSLANNHINDSLSEGIASTCDFLDAQGIAFVGAARTKEEQNRVGIFERNGIRVAVLGYTFSTNNIPLAPGFEHGTNLVRFNALCDEDYEPALIHQHIARAKALGADYIVACNHFGIDLEHYPPPRLVKRSRDLIDAGVDLIIGHHPHVIGPVESRVAPDGRVGIICYSLGNLTARGLVFAVQRLSQIAHLELEVGLDSCGKRRVRPARFALTPVYHSQDKVAGQVNNRLLPLSLLDTHPEALSLAQRRTLRALRKRHDEVIGSPPGLEIR
jgi:poly-gamma-glutamate synthesis protein (capsule biosynthesis protein)